MRKAAAKKPIAIHASSDKLEMIRSGKRKKTVTGFKENKNITISNEKGKFIAVEKEKKFEEAGVTRKKKNFIMFESKLGTERERDLHKIEGARLKATPSQRVEERIYTIKNPNSKNFQEFINELIEYIPMLDKYDQSTFDKFIRKIKL